jgi:glucokinase
MCLVAAFGIGSTNFRYVAGTPSGEFLTEIRIQPSEPRRLLAQLTDAIRDLQGRTGKEIESVAISVTGLVNADAGVIEQMDTSNGETVYDIPVRETLQEQFGVGTAIENDCNGAALAEYTFGDGQEYDTLAHVTIGTGIGGGVIENGKLLRGEHGQAVEVGQCTVDANGDLEAFGIPGAWEAYCSGVGIPQYVRHRLREESRTTCLTDIDDLDAVDFFDAVDRGDAVAREYLDAISRYNAAGVAGLVNVCNPGIVTFGGGIIHNQPRVMEGIDRYLDEYLVVTPPELRITSLGEEIGLYGALALSRYHEDGHATARSDGSVRVGDA